MRHSFVEIAQRASASSSVTKNGETRVEMTFVDDKWLVDDVLGRLREMRDGTWMPPASCKPIP